MPMTSARIDGHAAKVSIDKMPVGDEVVLGTIKDVPRNFFGFKTGDRLRFRRFSDDGPITACW
jgi:hypothetical protein